MFQTQIVNRELNKKLDEIISMKSDFNFKIQEYETKIEAFSLENENLRKENLTQQTLYQREKELKEKNIYKINQLQEELNLALKNLAKKEVKIF